jgi:hypothetical protein
MSERAMLMQLVEAADEVEPNWQDALRRAGFRGQHFPSRAAPLRSRRALVLAVIALAVIYAVSAVAARNPRVGPVYWLFDRSDETYPVHQAPNVSGWVDRERGIPWNGAVRSVPVLRGTVAGHRFELSALTRWGAVALGFSAGGPARPLYGTNVPSVGSGSAATVRGLPVPEAVGGRRFEAPDLEDQHWVSWTLDIPQGFEASGGGTGPKWIYGVANPRVARVHLEDEVAGTVVSVPTFAGPEDYPVRLRVWVAVLRLDQLVNAVVPRDKDGEELERWELSTSV